MKDKIDVAQEAEPVKADESAAHPADLFGDQEPTVLIVDDDPDILRIVQFYLKKQKYLTYTATNGEEALAALYEHPSIDLVLSDVMMPRMNGLELLQAIRADGRFADISVVLISAEGQTAKKVAGLEMGADDYITKPFNFDELMARVRNHIRLRRLQREVLQKNQLLKQQNDQFLSDLEAARSVQMALMPHAFPENDVFRLGARYIPLDRVGGDFFDVVVLDEGRKIGLFIADVCGHGVAASFITAMTKISFRNVCFTSQHPGKILEQMNQELYSYMQNGFVTVFYGVLDVPSLSFQYSSGGHPPLLVYRESATQIIELQPQATFLGFFESVVFPTDRFQFEKGDRLLLYTDGLYEGQNGDKMQFGMERVCQLVREHTKLSIQELINLLIFNLFDFIGDASLDDDITLLGMDILD